jgi:hypothetical protein
MKVFLSHSSEDKDVVEPIGNWLSKKGLDVWLDSWCLTAGDSLVEKIGEGIETSDRLVVFFTPASAESAWVKKEVANGLVMEIADEKGLGEKFVIPSLLIPCKIPILLRDKLYANFTNKSFDAACEELYRGVMGQPLGPQNKSFENHIFRHFPVKPQGSGKYALILEFGVRISPTEGLHIGVDLGVEYFNQKEWFGPPNNPVVPNDFGGAYTNSSRRVEPSIYARKFSSPFITSTKSYYLYFEAEQPFNIKEVQFLDYYDRRP